MSKRIRVSHLTIAQAARFLDVAQQSAHERLRPLAIEEFGVWMVDADHVRVWYRERLKAQRAEQKALGTMHP